MMDSARLSSLGIAGLFTHMEFENFQSQNVPNCWLNSSSAFKKLHTDCGWPILTKGPFTVQPNIVRVTNGPWP